MTHYRRLLRLSHPAENADDGSGTQSLQRLRHPDRADAMRDDLHVLPTPRTTLQSHYVCVLVWCKSCRHQRDADLQALVDAGRGDVPLVNLRFRLLELRRPAHGFRLHISRHDRSAAVAGRRPGSVLRHTAALIAVLDMLRLPLLLDRVGDLSPRGMMTPLAAWCADTSGVSRWTGLVGRLAPPSTKKGIIRNADGFLHKRRKVLCNVQPIATH
jgi:hypothetical protein